MSDVDIEGFRVQLAQVEAAIAFDPNNQQLTKLKQDLEEVICVSSELKELSSRDIWRVGDHCQSYFSQEEKQFHCVILEIDSDGTCNVARVQDNVCQTVNLSSLKKHSSTEPVREKNDTFNKRMDPSYLNAKKKMEMREKKRLKKQNKRSKIQEIEEKRESEKQKWVEFHKTTGKKAKTGFLYGKEKNSIFASTTEGKIGVIGSGKGMTTFSQPTKMDPTKKLKISAFKKNTTQ